MRGRFGVIFLTGLAVCSMAAAQSAPSVANTPAAAKTDEHSGAGTSSNINKVLQPYENVQFEPAWTNNNATASITGTITSFTGPAGATYGASYTSGGSADYGSVAGGATANCYDATATHSCYELSVSPTSGTRPIQHWDATFTEHLSSGDTKAWPVHIGDSFDDVPASSGIYRFVETIYHKGITSGCGGAVGLSFCPSTSVTRQQIAVFLLVAEHGAAYTPPACTTPAFTDVPCTSGFAKWVNQLVAESVTGGCQTGLFCPTLAVNRGQMAVFLLRAHVGPTYTPPACTTPLFNDVPCSSPLAPWVNELANRGIAAGCANGNFCIGNTVTRGQMAVFLTATFSLTLYGP